MTPELEVRWLRRNPTFTRHALQTVLRGCVLYQLDDQVVVLRRDEVGFVEAALKRREAGERRPKAKTGPKTTTLQMGREAYHSRREGAKWFEVLGRGREQSARRAARIFAGANGLPWPVPIEGKTED